MNTQTANCRYCSSTDTIRHGYTAKGKQRYRSRDYCGRCFVEAPGSTAYDPAPKEEILRAYHERTSSLRGISRIFGVSRNTVTQWLKKSGRIASFGTNAGSFRRQRGGPGAG